MPVNNASQQSLISLVDAFRDVAIPKNGGKKQYLVAGNGNKNHEIDGVSHENTKRIFTSDKNYGWRDAVNVLNGKRNTHYATARAALQKLIAGALREGVLKDQDQYKAVFELERLLKKSVSSGRVKIDETAQKNLGTVLDAIETAGKRAAKEGVQKDCRVVDGKAVHFFAEIQQRQTSSEHIPHPYDSAKKFGNAAVWTRIGSLNTQAKKIKNPATVERLKLRQSFSLSKKSSSAGSVNLLHKLEDWPGPVFQDTLRQFFEAADRQNSDGLKEASKRLLGCMNEARSFLTLTRDVLYSEAFINSIADNEDREKLKMLCGTAIRLLANIDDPDSPFARLKNLAVVADRSPDETCKELAAERRALLVPAVPAPDPTPVIDQPDPLNAGPDLSIVPAPLDNPPPPAHVLVQPSGSGQPPANGNGNVPQPLVANPASGSNSLPPDQPAPLNSIPANGVGSNGQVSPGNAAQPDGNAMPPLGIVAQRKAELAAKLAGSTSSMLPSHDIAQPSAVVPQSASPDTAAVSGVPLANAAPPLKPAQPQSAKPRPLPSIPANKVSPDAGNANAPEASTHKPATSTTVQAAPINAVPGNGAVSPGNATKPASKPLPSGAFVTKRVGQIEGTPPGSSSNQAPLGNNDTPPSVVVPKSSSPDTTSAGASLPSLGAKLPPANVDGGDVSVPPPDYMPPPATIVTSAVNKNVPLGVDQLPLPPDTLPPPLPPDNTVSSELSAEQKDALSKSLSNPGIQLDLEITQAIADSNWKSRVVYSHQGSDVQEPGRTATQTVRNEQLSNQVKALKAKIAANTKDAAKWIQKKMKNPDGKHAKIEKFEHELVSNAKRGAQTASVLSDLEASKDEYKQRISLRQQEIGRLYEEILEDATPTPHNAVDRYVVADGEDLKGKPAENNYFRRLVVQFQMYMKPFSPRLPEESEEGLPIPGNKIINKIIDAGKMAGGIQLAAKHAFPEFGAKTEEFILRRPALEFWMPKGFTTQDIFAILASAFTTKNNINIANLFQRIGNERNFRLAAEEMKKGLRRQFDLLVFLTQLLTDEEYLAVFPDEIRASVRQYGRLIQEFAVDVMNPDSPFLAAYRLAEAAQESPFEVMMKLNEAQVPAVPADLPEPLPAGLASTKAQPLIALDAELGLPLAVQPPLPISVSPAGSSVRAPDPVQTA